MAILNTELDEIVLSGSLSTEETLNLTEEDIDTLLLDSTIWAKKHEEDEFEPWLVGLTPLDSFQTYLDLAITSGEAAYYNSGKEHYKLLTSHLK